MNRRPYAAIGTAAAGAGFALYLALRGPVAIFQADLTYTEDLPACSADPGCVLDSVGGVTALTATSGDAGTITLTNGAANGSEAAPMVSGSGATVYAQTITSTAPSIAAGSVPEDVRTLWSASHTCIFAVNARTTGASRSIFGYGDTAADGVYLLTTDTNTTAAWRGAGSEVSVNAAPASSSTNEWAAIAFRKSGTSFSVCVNGVCGAPTVNALTIVDPGTDDALFFGAAPNGASPLNGAYQRGRCYASALSDAAIQLKSAQLLKGLAVRPADTYFTTTRASVAYDTYSSTLIAPSGDNVRIPHSTKGLASFSQTINLALQRRDLNTTWTKTASVTVAADSASCPMSRIGDVRMDLADNTAAANTGGVFQNVAVSSSTGPFMAAVDVATTSGAGTKTLELVCGTSTTTVATCTCVRDDGGACTASISGDRCQAKLTASTTPVRVAVTATCTAAVNNIWIQVTPGDRGTATGTACFDLEQIGTGSAPLPYCDNPTQTASATCAADVHTLSTTGWPTTSGEVSITYTAQSSTSTANRVLLDTRTTATTQGVLLYIDTSNRLNFLTYAGAFTCSVQSAAQTFTAERKVEARWSATTCEVLMDGTSLAASAAGTGSPASHDTAGNLGSNLSGGEQAQGHVKLLCAARQGGCPQ